MKDAISRGMTMVMNPQQRTLTNIDNKASYYSSVVPLSQKSYPASTRMIEPLVTQPQEPKRPTDATDLIRKFKSLLDDGIITQEEFEKKKKELLDLK